ncbi:MAG: ATP-binding protein [Bacteroidales bacterium]|nr:ATP-binding protein [Bacteroidales bacterium]
MIKRDIYLDRIAPYIDKPVIKVITGIRRCGKSTFLKLLMKDLQNKGVSPSCILYINKDSLKYDFIRTYTDLHTYVSEHLKPATERRYLFIDEIQEIEQWEKAVAGFYADESADIYITGSNADLLNSELADLLTGRYIEFRMSPLVFREFLKFRNKSEADKEDEFFLFLKYGGFPGIHSLHFDDEVISQYTGAIYSTILLKDVVSRNQVRDVALLERIMRYLADNCGNITTAKGISNFIRSQQLTCSADTVQNYLHWINQAYLAHRVSRFDVKGKRLLELYDKYYLGDAGFIYTLLGDKFHYISGKLENIVYLELISRGYKVNIGKLYDREIDFIAIKENKKLYIQVAYMLTDETVIEREFGILESLKDNYPKIVLSMDKHFGSERNGIEWRNLVDFLLSPL